MASVGVKLIEQKRESFVEQEAEKLFAQILDSACTQEPQSKYEVTVLWTEQPPILNQMILNKAKDLFKVAGSDLEVLAQTSETLRVALTPESSDDEEMAVKLFWSRQPGKFVNKNTGKGMTVAGLGIGPEFSGTVREWYETLVETIIDCGNQMVRKTDAKAKKLYVGADALTLLECSVLYKPNFGRVPDESVEGMLSNRFEIYRDSSLKSTIRLIGVKDGKRIVGEVEILDFNIV